MQTRFAAALCSLLLLIGGQALAQNAYITNFNSSTVSVIDTATNMLIATIPVGPFPLGVAVSSNGKRAYIAHNDNSGMVSVIDTATNTVIATIHVPSSVLYGVAVTPDGSKLYVTGDSGVSAGVFNIVSVIDTATNTVTAKITVGLSPRGIAVSPDGTKVYVANAGSDNTVSVINTANNTVIATISGAGQPVGVAVSPDNSKIYVTNNGGILQVIATATNTLIQIIVDRGQSDGVAVSPDGTRIYVANVNTGNVLVFDALTNTVIATIPVGPDGDILIGLAVTPDGRKVYVAHTNTDTVSVIDTATNTKITEIGVGNYPVAFGIFIQPKAAAKFAGTPGFSNCQGVSWSALALQFGSRETAAAILGYPNVKVLQTAIQTFCLI